MAYPDKLLTEDEEVIRDFHAHWRILLPAIGMTLVLFAAAAVATAMAGSNMVGPWSVTLIAWTAAVAISLGVWIRPLTDWLYTLYILTTERIIVRRGILARSGTEIPLENIVNVHTSQRLFERILGYGDVLLESAGSTGQSRLTDIPDPQTFQAEIYSAREQRMFVLERGGRSAESVPRDVTAQLAELSALHDAGKLTDDEFATQKRRLLEE